MAGEINWGLMDPQGRSKIINSFAEGQQQARQNRLAELQLAGAEQASADDAGMRADAIASGGDLNRLAQLAQQGGRYKQAAEIQARILDQRAKTAGIAKDEASVGKIAAETKKAEIENHLKSFETVGQIMAGVKDQATYDAARQQVAQTLGFQAASRMPPTYDPAAIEQRRLQAMSVKEQLENQWKTLNFEYQKKNDARNDERIRSEGDKNRAQSERHFKTTQTAPQYMETDAGLVALPKKLEPGQVPVGTPVASANGQPLGKPLKDIPASVNTAIIVNTQNLQKARQALKLLEGKKIGEMQGDQGATGYKGFLPGAILNRIDPSGVDTRAAIADLGSMVLHDRSGAAVTAAEYPRLQPFIPTATDDADTAAKKLKRFIQVYEQENQAFAETYSKAQGYKPSPLTQAKPASDSGDIHAQADAILRGK